MLQNNESYKRIDLTLVGFSMRLLNTARRNGLHTLYDLIESYNSGSFAKMRNIGKTTIQELENFDFSSVSAISGIQASAIDDITPVEETEEVIPIVWDDILPATYLDSGFEKNIFNSRLNTYFKENGIKTMRDVLGLSAIDMQKWKKFGKRKTQLVLELQKRALTGEECVIFDGTVKTLDEFEPTREIDTYVLELLKTDYGLKYVWLCDWFGVTRQSVEQKVQRVSCARNAKWDGFDYTEAEEKILIDMLKNRNTSYSSENKYYYFLKNNKGNYALLLVNNKGIRCIFDDNIHGDLKKYIIDNRLNELDFREIEIRENGSEVSILKTVYFVPDKSDDTTYKAYAKRRGMTNEEYAIFLSGKPYTTNHFIITDELICKFFEENLNDEGKVYISSDHSNHWIRSYASRKGYRISEFIEFYGYQSALSDEALKTVGAKKRHSETIKNYIVYDNVVYIPTCCDFYRILNSFSSNRGMTISEYVAELGYERTLTPGELFNTAFSDDESDMEIYESSGSFLEKVFARNPILGNYILSENNLQILHNNAKRVIDDLVANHKNKLNKEQKMTVALSVINYAKYWDTELGSFTSYIIKQYGYRSEDKVYYRIMAVAFEALAENRRWKISFNGRNEYKSTIMIHAMGSVRTWMILCDFLSDFYQNNLGCHYVENDPYILNMVMSLRGLFYNSVNDVEGENDIEIRVGKKPYMFHEGVRKLIVYRPHYAAKVFDRMLKRIHSYMNAGVLPAKKYEDSLVDLWFKNKTEYYFKYKRNTDRVKANVSRRIAFDYTHIRLDYKFYNNNVWIEIPDIRLTLHSTDACFFEIYLQEELIEKKSLKCYGNELGRTISGFTYSLNDYISIIANSEIAPRIVIKCGDKIIYDSLQKLRRKMIVFSGEKEISSVEVGGYIVVAPRNIEVSGTNVESSVIKTVENFKYLFVDLRDDYSLVVDDIIVSFDFRKAEKIHINLPHYVRGVKYIEEGLEYSICRSNGEISIAVDENDVEQKYVVLLNGKQIYFTNMKHNVGEGVNVYTMPSQAWDNKNRLQIVDFSCDKIVVDKWFIFIPAFSFSFDSQFYFTPSDVQGCCLEYSVAGEEYEITNTGSDTYLTTEYLNGKLEFEMPIIKLVDTEGKAWINRQYFIDEIDRGLYLKLNSILGVEGKIFIGDTEVQRDAMGLYTIGNTVYSLMNPKTETLKLILINQNSQKKIYSIGKIIFKEQFVSAPKLEYIEGNLTWDCGYGFVGNRAKDTFIRIIDEVSKIVFESKLDLDATLISDSVTLADGEYKYCIFRESEDLFSLDENELAQGAFVCGNYDKIRFNNSKIVISQIVFDNAVSTGVVNIMTTYIDNIKYDEEISNEEGSEGICPTYFGTMYFINPNGKRHNYAFDDEYRSDTDVRLKTNPVKIVYINESVLLVTDSEDDALIYKFYYDKYTHEKVYHITDHKPTAFDRNNYDTVDLLRYRKESL